MLAGTVRKQRIAKECKKLTHIRGAPRAQSRNENHTGIAISLNVGDKEICYVQTEFFMALLSAYVSYTACLRAIGK